jgi:hypothetical protein
MDQKKCYECGRFMLKDTWINKPNEAEGETGIIEQKLWYCNNCDTTIDRK